MFKNLFQSKENKQESASSSANSNKNPSAAVEDKVEEKKKVHGEDGVCCGGCGGQ